MAKSRLVGWSQWVDATPSGINLLSKRWCSMRPGKRFGLSAIEKSDIWRRWKAGETLHEIGRAFDKPHTSIRCLLLPRGGIPPAIRRRSHLALTRSEREDISRGFASCSSFRDFA